MTSTSAPSTTPVDRSAPRRLLAPLGRLGRAVLVATIAVWALCALALLIYTSGARSPETYTLVIPDGAREQIARGENPLELPAAWSFLDDDTLRLVNDDRVDHRLGSYFVPARTTREFRLQPGLGGSLFCSLHPAGEIRVDVDVRDFDWLVTIVPTLALGPALGVIWVGVRRVVGILDEPDGRTFSSSLRPGELLGDEQPGPRSAWRSGGTALDNRPEGLRDE